MKTACGILVSILLIAPACAQNALWHKSPELEGLIVELNDLYTSDDLFPVDKRKMTQVDSLSYFIRFVDKPNAPEHKVLKAYLWGVQEAYIISINRQLQTNITPWFCPKGFLKNFSYNAENPTKFVENLAWQGLDYTLKYSPNRFRRPDLPAAFAPLSDFIADGLLAKYPCYESAPHAKRFVKF